MGTWAKEQRSVTVPTPVLDDLGQSRSLHDGLTKLNQQGRLHRAAAELESVAKAADSLRGVSKAAEYRRKAAVLSDPVDRATYIRLAEELENGGTL